MRIPLLLIAVALLPVVAAAQSPATVNYLTAEEKAAGWKLLFDGKTVNGLRGVQKPDFLKAGWKIEDGALVLHKTIDQSGKVTGGDLATTEAFTDFEFSFEWKVEVAADSGILYFARAGFGQKPVGHEFQVIDDTHHPDGLKGGPLRRSGALYGLIQPGENKHINDTGWNAGAIVVNGNHVEHWVNGEKVVEYDLGTPAFMQALRASKLKLPMGFGTKTKSPILLLDQGEGVAFRSIKVRATQPVAPTAPAAAGARPQVPGAPAAPQAPGQPAPVRPVR